MQQLHPRLQAHIRTCMAAQPDPTRTPYERMVAILIQQVAPGKPEDHLHPAIALIARRTDTHISRLHMQFTEAYHAYRDLCARLRSRPHLGEHFVVTAFLGNLPNDIVRDTRKQPSAADRLNVLQYLARLAINFDTLARTYPGRCEHRPHDDNTLILNDNFYEPLASAGPPSATPPAAPRPQATPPAHRQQRTAPTPSDLFQEPPPASWAASTPPPEPADTARSRPAKSPQQPDCPDSLTRAIAGPVLFLPRRGPRPPRLPSYLRACQHNPMLAFKCPACRAPGFCPSRARAATTISGPSSLVLHGSIPVSCVDSAPRRRACSHTRLGIPPRTPNTPTRTIDGVRCELLGRVALELRLGPLKTTAPFFVVPGVAFAVLLGVDFIYEHEIAVSLARHASIFEGQGGQAFTLLGHHPRLAPLCALAHDVALNPGNTSWVRSNPPPSGTRSRFPPGIFGRGVHTPQCGPRDPGAADLWPHRYQQHVRSPAALERGVVARQHPDPAPAPADGAGETPAYEKVPGGFFPTLPSPSSCLLPTELQQLRDVLHEFRDRFNDGSEPFPATFLLKVRLDTGNAQPISPPPRRLSPAMRQAVRDAVAELDAQGITEPSTGCWSTPIVMVRKASGAWRLCCDYRAIDEHVRIPQQPPRRTDDILASFNGKKYFSVLDMCKGSYQIEVFDEVRAKTSFVTPECQRQYRGLPFGFASSPATFPRMVDLLLGGMNDTWDAHRAHLQQLFQALRAATLQLHPGKCSFGAAAVRYLGHIVSRDGVNPCPLKIQAILDMPVPKTAKAVQPFLGKCQYYRKFITNFSIIAAPLFHAATRQKDFSWTPAADTAWRTLCKALISEPVLAHADYTRPFNLDCDGSEDGMGAVLLQPYDGVPAPRALGAAPARIQVQGHPAPGLPAEACRLSVSGAPSAHSYAAAPDPGRVSGPHGSARPRRAPGAAGSCQLWCAPLCGAVNHVAHRAHRRMRLLRHRLRQLCAAARSSARLTQPPTTGSEDEADVRSALQTPKTTALGPRPPSRPTTPQPRLSMGGATFFYPSLSSTSPSRTPKPQDPECQEFLRLARIARAAWPLHLRHTPLHFCVLHDLVYVRTGDAVPRVILPAIFRSRTIQAHHLSYYGCHFGVSKTAARVACSPFFLVTGQKLVLPLSRQSSEPVLHPSGARWLHAFWRCRLAVLRSHQRVADANRKLFLEEPHRLESGVHVALRIPAKERAAQGKFSPVFRGGTLCSRGCPSHRHQAPCQPDSPQVSEAPQPSSATIMQSPPHTRSRTEREVVVEVEPPHRIASQQTVQQPSPAAALPAATPSSPVARKRQRTEPAEPRVVSFVVGKFRPSKLKDIKNAKKRLAKPQTQEPLQHKEITYLHRRLKAYKDVRKEAPCGKRMDTAARIISGQDERASRILTSSGGDLDEWLSPFAKLERRGSGTTSTWPSCPKLQPSRGGELPRGQVSLPPSQDILLRDPRPEYGKCRAGRRCPFMSLGFSHTSTRIGSDGTAVRHDFSSSVPAYGIQQTGAAAATIPIHVLSRRRIGRHGRRSLRHHDGALCVVDLDSGSGVQGSFDYHLEELQRVDHTSRTVAAARAVLIGLSQEPGSLTGLANPMRIEQLRNSAVTDDQVERLVGFCLPSTERLSALMGPGRASLRESFNGVHLTGQALLGSAVAASVPLRLVAVTAASREQGEAARPAEPDSASAPPGASDTKASSPPLPTSRTGEFRLPGPSVAPRDPPQQLGRREPQKGAECSSP
ncbi:hypothetical protein Emag_006158 [Eimeria magna]